jgi:hypothetical protein
MSTVTQKYWYDYAPAATKPYIQLARVDKIAGALLFFWPAGSLEFLGIGVYLSEISFQRGL